MYYYKCWLSPSLFLNGGRYYSDAKTNTRIISSNQFGLSLTNTLSSSNEFSATQFPSFPWTGMAALRQGCDCGHPTCSKLWLHLCFFKSAVWLQISGSSSMLLIVHGLGISTSRTLHLTYFIQEFVRIHGL